MNKLGAGVAAVVAIITVVGVGTYSFDFSSTTIGQIGDNIINQYFEDQGIDIEEFRKMCKDDLVHEQLKRYCDLV